MEPFLISRPVGSRLIRKGSMCDLPLGSGDPADTRPATHEMRGHRPPASIVQYWSQIGRFGLMLRCASMRKEGCPIP